ncbi:type II toxin-antitoxin system YafQ family toxin, partial [Klebsiella pneumoniae]
MSFSEDDCTRQRGLKAVVQSSIERTVSGVRCTNDDLKPVLVALATDQPLDVRYRDHDLSGDWAGYREGTVAKLAMRQPFVLFKGLTFQKLCLPGAFRPGDHHN